MKPDGRLRNNLKQIRTRQAMSQQELATQAGVSRQTISGVESDLYAPSAAVAIRMARALGCRVEDLFWLEEDLHPIEALPAASMPSGQAVRVRLGRIGGRWVAHPLVGDLAFRTELIPADGAGRMEPRAGQMQLQLLDDPASLAQTVFLAGCSPAISLWALAAERWHPGLRVHWITANSMAALLSLKRGEVHAAGLHLYDATTGEFNAPFVRAALPGHQIALINVGTWEEGLLVQQGNPKGIKSVADLAQPGVTLVNREPGAGSRLLLEEKLRLDTIPSKAVEGFEQVVFGHLEVAQAIAGGQADVGVSTTSVASAYGLDFIPLQKVRYDMAVPREYLDEGPVRQLLGTLGHQRVRSQLKALGGYETTQTGEIVAKINF